MRRKELEELKKLREEKKAEEEENIRKKVEDKIVKKAINIKKKHVTKKEILERILDESSEEDSEPEKIERKRAPIAKKKPKTETETKEQVTKNVVVAREVIPNRPLGTLPMTQQGFPDRVETNEYPRKFIFLK
jgi:hypothetical protein